jgi:hypothetical protein
MMTISIKNSPELKVMKNKENDPNSEMLHRALNSLKDEKQKSGISNNRKISENAQGTYSHKVLIISIFI